MNAAAFQARFQDVYKLAREMHRDQWPIIWTDTARWSSMMIYSLDAVVRKVANELGLRCHPGEPLRLDAVFTDMDAPRWEWFPFLVAIEHENNPLTFGDEIRKLRSVRCPLKVGITYALSSDARDPARLCIGIVAEIQRLFAAIDTKISEDDDAEYLFLIGIETPLGAQELQWHSLCFRAGEGPRIDQTFAPIA